MQLLAYYGSPLAFARDPGNEERIRKWGRSGLKAPKIARIVESAKATKGAPTTSSKTKWIQTVATMAINALREVQRCGRELKCLSENNTFVQTVGKHLGVTTACVLWSTAGDPANYSCGHAYRKSLGLNLKESSSGKHRGELSITKRGSSLARRWLYYAALRAVQQPGVKEWFESMKSRNTTAGGLKGLIAVMRKLAISIWRVATTGEEFCWSKVFPGEPVPRPCT
jgi:hypothetical protein